MAELTIGKVYFIKDDAVSIKDVSLSNNDLRKQKLPGLGRRIMLHSSEELKMGQADLYNTYKCQLDESYTIVRAIHPAMCDMGEINIFPEYEIDIYIPFKPNLDDVTRLKEVLDIYKEEKEYAFRIINCREDDYDLYDYDNFSYIKRNIGDICEYYYKEKNNVLTPLEQEMFDRYRNFDLHNLILEDYYNYLLNNRNAAIFIVTPRETIKKTVTKSFHKREILSSLNHLLTLSDVDKSVSYSKLVSDYNLVLGFITKDSIGVYVNSDINDYQHKKLEEFVDEVYDVKTYKEDLITNVNVIKDNEIVFDGELNSVKTFFGTKNKNR